MAINKVKLPNGNTENIQDSRILGVDTTPTSGSGNLVTSGGVKSALDGKMNIGGIVSDFNTETTPGNYAIDYEASANRPSINYGQALVLNAATDTVAQLAFNYNSGSAYFRGGSSWGSSWNRWREFAFKDDLSGYLPLTGGTLTGLLRISSGNDAKIILDNTDNETNYQQIVFSQNGTEYARLGTFSDTILRWQIGEASYKIWHEGNDGSGSGLDADLLDGKHADSFATIASPNNLIHNGNEFTFIPPNYSSNIWFNYKTSDYSLSGAVTEYLFGDGAGHALASITQGQFSGNAATATKLETARSIWGQNFDGSGNVDGILTGVNSDNTTGIGTAIAIGCPSVDGLSAAGNGVGITMGLSGKSYYAKIATVFEDSNPRYLQPALAFYTMYNSNRAGSEVERMRISANGYVGIGTTSPERNLDVVGSLQAGNGTYESVLEANSDGGRLTFWSNSSLWHKGYIDGSTVVINTISGGNVGIGTTSPAYKLTVAGTIRSENQSDGFPSFRTDGANSYTAFASFLGGSRKWQMDTINDGSMRLYLDSAGKYLLNMWPSGTVEIDGGITTTLQTSEPSGGMLPNREYKLGTLSSATTFTLAAETSGVTNHYFWTFETGSTAPTITWPSAITSWAGGSAPSINSNRHYEVSVLNGVAVVLEV